LIESINSQMHLLMLLVDTEFCQQSQKIDLNETL